MPSEYINVLIFVVSLVIGIVLGSLLLLGIFYFQQRAYSRHKVKVLNKREKRKAKIARQKQKQEAKQQKRAQAQLAKQEKKKEKKNRPTKLVNTKSTPSGDTSRLNLHKKNKLQERLLMKEGCSWTEFNCDADDISQEDYIHKIRQKEDEAYQYAKRMHKGI